jgi:TatA/E family protein of Tat protein translocase
MGRIEEFLLVFFVGLLLFGPHKLKDIASSLGGALNEFKKAMNPEGQNTQAVAAPHIAQQPAYAPAAPAPVRRARKSTAAKKTKASRA